MNHRYKNFVFVLLVSNIMALMLLASSGFGQNANEGLLKSFTWRNIGPANMGGRTVDIEGVESNPKIIYAGTATSGVWKTVNAGITWEPIFDDQPVASIGDLAVSTKDPNIVYVGTGEANGRNSSPWGAGVFKSTDGGDSWEFVGLKNTQHIGRVLIDPEDPDVVYVAAVGRLWGHSEDRGLYKTTDGGKNWEKILYLNERTGVTDVAMDPENNDILYAAAYERMRDGFSGGNPAVMYGPEAGIYISRNAGKDWDRVTDGLPNTEMGRIGLAVSRSNPGTLYAQIQTRFSRRSTEQGGRGGRGGRGGGGRGGRGGQPQIPPEEYNRENADKFQGIYKSTDHGRSWTWVGSEDNRPFYYSQLRVDPNDENVLWAGGLNLRYSEDGGVTFESVTGTAHVDHHAIWIDPNDSDHVISGCDGGINITFDRGENWDVITQMPMAQFYAITADMRKPYHVYGGLQDNGTWGGPSQTRSRWGIRNYHWYVIGGGDGFFAQVDPVDPNIVYSESQNGGLRRLDLSTGVSRSIRPGLNNTVNLSKFYPDLANRQEGGGGRGGGGRGGGRGGPFRFDWNSPILISPHNNTTILFGGNHVFKSVNRGDQWSIVSEDLTSSSGRTAVVSIDESPIIPGVIWAGTNDGNVWLTRNHGENWTRLNGNIPNAPEKYWVKRLEASNHDPARAYLVFDGHRNDDQNPYVFVTDDYGQSWRSITSNLPEGSVYVVREDYINPDLLFAGTEFSIFVSLDRGRSWDRFMNGFPTVPVHDLYIHPRDGDLIAGTHGRGAWIADNITPLQQLANVEDDVHLFDIRPATQWKSMYEWRFITQKTFIGKNPPTGSQIHYFLKTKAANAELEITDVTGEKRFSTAFLDEDTDPGTHSFIWNFRFNQSPLNEEERSQFENRIQTAIDEEESEERKAEIQSLLDKFRQSSTNAQLITYRRKLQPYAGGGRGGGRGGGGSNTASPGEYLVTLTVDGKVMVTTLTIVEDKPINMMIK